ncbi:MAG: TrbC/VirB2 family protein [Candidatus Moranbacteria bacterium]|nr:TrbC/VirB2 family protein [Candidatus Moranbacteria bacterium]
MKKNILKKTKFITLLFFFGIAFLANAQTVALPKNTGLPSGTLTSVISNLTNWLLGIFGFLAIISFIISGIMYILAVGDDKAQEKAKKQMRWSIVGVVIGLVGVIIINAVDALLRGVNNKF